MRECRPIFYILFHIQTFPAETIYHLTLPLRKNLSLHCGIIPILHKFNHPCIPSYSLFSFTTGVPCLVVMGLDTQLESLRLTEGKVDKSMSLQRVKIISE